MKQIGFLSFGHWTPSPQSQTRSASDALQQSIELAVAAEELGADGAYFRVHHFARQLGSPFPLLAACGARTKRIEIGTAVIDMRYALRQRFFIAPKKAAKLMRNWTTKEILILKRAYRRGLSPDAITELLPRHSVRGIVVRARKEGIRISRPHQTEAPTTSLTKS